MGFPVGALHLLAGLAQIKKKATRRLLGERKSEAFELKLKSGSFGMAAAQITVRRAEAEAEPNGAPSPITDQFSRIILSAAALYSLKRFALAQLLSQC
jgi:hypothetical protein